MFTKLLACTVAAAVFAGTAPASFAQTSSNHGTAFQVAQNGTSEGATTSGSDVTGSPGADAATPPLSGGGAAGLATAAEISTPVLLGLAAAAVIAGVLVASSGGGNHPTTTTSPH